MKGDFSRWDLTSQQNINGVLHQQGRVLLDRDWNDQTRIGLEWQDQAARQIIGAGVAAIPAHEANGFKVIGAAVDDGNVKVEVQPGRGWADGLAVHLPSDSANPAAAVTRAASYLQPPLQAPPGDPAEIGEGVRDAVILEVWREALNGFQVPAQLIEPALGGPDTTERVHTAMRFRLFRLAPEESCRHLIGRLQDDFSQKGTLTVSLRPTTATEGDCPTVEGGGYIGFEHFLYRIEMGRVNAGTPVMFKWSREDGGLVGRGECDLGGADKKISISGNEQAIKMSGLNDFYLEVVEFDVEQGFWRVTYGADVTLSNGDLEVSTERYTEANRPTGRVFFRLWNGIEQIAAFPPVVAPTEPNELQDGIRLAFDPDNGTNYRPGDYWIFKVRAGELSNPDPVIDHQPPQGVRYHRVPLAILNWSNEPEIRFDAQQISDCRDVFRPLTNQSTCCSFTVGDGKSSFGDFNSIEEALRHLPASGGELCLLPGLHEANVQIEGKQNIKITGCDKKTRVIPRSSNEQTRQAPIFSVTDSRCITLSHLDLVTLSGRAIVLSGSEPGTLQEISIAHNRILACQQAIRVTQGLDIHIHHNKIRMLDKENGDVAIYILADDGLIERNDISIVPAGATPPPNETPDGDDTPDPSDPCAEAESFYNNPLYLVVYINYVWSPTLTLFLPTNPFQTLGGIQLASGSERIKLIENQISGGAGNGITLGSDLQRPDSSDDPAPDEPQHEIRHEQRQIWGQVVADEQRISGITLFFTSNNGATITAVSDDSGEFLVEAEVGVYSVSISPPDYEIASIESRDIAEFGVLHQINVVPIEKEDELSDVLAYMYDIVISHNEISDMGRSGIGIPQINKQELAQLTSLPLLARSFGVVGGFVVNLSIHRNQIWQCQQNLFDPNQSELMQQRGVGGISLGLCEKLLIQENCIENNGRSDLEPTCGIFVSYADQVEISHNQVLNNGPLNTRTTTTPQQGIRGGIVLSMAASRSISELAAATEEPSVARGRSFAAVSISSRANSASYAARIHDNVVEQPVGHALAIIALGPLSILNNQFNTVIAGPGPLHQLAGALLIINLARPLAQTPRSTALPNGNTLFNNNQIHLTRANQSITSQLIITADDLGFIGNQSDVLSEQRLLTNTFLYAQTLRASSNRLKEPPGQQRKPPEISLLTFSSLMNNTTNNQGDHCIIALNQAPGRPAVDFGNLTLQRGDECANSTSSFEKQYSETWSALRQQIKDNPSQAWSRLNQFQPVSQALLQHEAKRLTRKFGQDHPHVRQVNVRLEQHKKMVRELEIEGQLAQIKVLEVEERDALIHGRLSDKKRRGLTDLSVHLENEQGQIIRFLGQAKTDPSGYYALRLAPATIKRLSQIKGDGVFLTISDRRGNVVHRQFTPLKVAEGERIVMDIALERERLRPRQSDKEPPSKNEKEKSARPAPIELLVVDNEKKERTPDVWVVRGQVTDQKNQAYEGLIVTLSDKDMLLDDQLGTTLTNQKGQFRLIYLSQDFRDLFDDEPDLYLKVMDKEGKLLYTSEQTIRQDAARSKKFNITINRER